MGIWFGAVAIAARCTVEVGVVTACVLAAIGSNDLTPLALVGSAAAFVVITVVHAFSPATG